MELKAISLNVMDESTSSLNENASRFEAISLPPNPFVGLRPFQSTEGLLFFGRREQTVELLHQLHRTRFVSVVGSSGCGKSSLIRAGVIPKLKAGFLVERRDQWRIALMKPGDAPLQNLTLALGGAFSEEPSDDSTKVLVKAIQHYGLQAIIDRLEPHLQKSDTNLLLLVDQFEEIFRFGMYTDDEEVRDEAGDKERRRDEAADFVSIMLGLAHQHDLPVYVVMTMRSDFLGECDAFYGLPEAMNRSQYLVPRLNRQQRQEAIESPIRLYGEEITDRLLDRVVNDVGEELDQLPVMQHALMRTWEKWREEGKGAIDLIHYDAIGTIKDALSKDAEKALEGMTSKDLTITERIFQALTQRDARGRRLRRPAHLDDLAALAGATREKAREIIERFRSNDRSFMSLSEDGLEGNPLVDISHESLIRQWGTLREWVDAEADSKEMYLRLAGDAVRKQKGLVPLWSDPALQLALDWRENRQPNPAWAERYHPDFKAAMDFLDESRDKRESDAEAAERSRQEQAERELRDLQERAAYRQRELELAQALATKQTALAGQQTEAAKRLRYLAAALLVMIVLAIATAAYAFRLKTDAQNSESTAKAATLLVRDSATRLEASLLHEKEQAAIVAKARDDLDKALKEAEAATLQAVQQKERAERQSALALGTQRANQMYRDATKYLEAADIDEAQESFLEAIKRYKKINDVDGVAHTYTELGNIQTRRWKTSFGRTPGPEQKEDIDYYKEAIKLYRQQGNASGFNGSADTYIKLAELLTDEGGDIFSDTDRRAATERVKARLGYLNEALGDYKKAQNLKGQIRTLVKIGDIHSVGKTAGDREIQEAIGYYEQAIPLYKTLIQQRGQGPKQARKVGELQEDFVSKLIRIGNLYHQKGDDVSANVAFEQAVNVYLSNPEKVAATWLEVAASSKPELKEEYYQKALSVNRQAGNLKGEAANLAHIGSRYLTLGLRASEITRTQIYKKALDYYKQASEIYDRLGDRKGQAKVSYGMGSTYGSLNQRELALEAYKSALASYIGENDVRGQAMSNRGIGFVQLSLNQTQEAIDSFSKALELFRQINDTIYVRDLQGRIDALKKPQPPKQ